MTKGLVTALCLSVSIALCAQAASAQEQDLSRLAGDWADRIAAIAEGLEGRPSTSFRLFNPDRLYPGPEDRTVEQAAWDALVTRKSTRDQPGVAFTASDGMAGLVLRF
jgi:hypothetical protein